MRVFLNFGSCHECRERETYNEYDCDDDSRDDFDDGNDW